MFEDFPTSDFRIVGSNGAQKGVVRGIYSPKQIIILDAQTDLAAGDELRRTIPSGNEEAFEVVDPVFHQNFHGVPAHFQVSIRRKGSFSAGTGGNYTVNVSGSNHRVNIRSTDNSINVVNADSVFADLKKEISSSVKDEIERQILLKRVGELELHAGDRVGFLDAYQKFITAAASHMGVIAPFLPALSRLLE